MVVLFRISFSIKQNRLIAHIVCVPLFVERPAYCAAFISWLSLTHSSCYFPLLFCCCFLPSLLFCPLSLLAHEFSACFDPSSPSSSLRLLSQTAGRCTTTENAAGRPAAPRVLPEMTMLERCFKREGGSPVVSTPHRRRHDSLLKTMPFIFDSRVGCFVCGFVLFCLFHFDT